MEFLSFASSLIQTTQTAFQSINKNSVQLDVTEMKVVHFESVFTLTEFSSKKNKIVSSFLCRVSFGSSKGSMVETLVFETPTPLPEHAEREFGFPPDKLSATQNAAGQCTNSSSGLDDSGIELQEE